MFIFRLTVSPVVLACMKMKSFLERLFRVLNDVRGVLLVECDNVTEIRVEHVVV